MALELVANELNISDIMMNDQAGSSNHKGGLVQERPILEDAAMPSARLRL